MSLRKQQIEAKIAERSHYEHRGYRDPETGEFDMCRIWEGPTSGDESTTRGHGYGRMNLDGATVAVHIAAWVNEHGLIPPRKQLDHLCHQRDCCEERHLKLKTHKQNQRNKRPRKVEFKLGHEIDKFEPVDAVTRTGVHGEVGPTGRIGSTHLKLVDVDLAHIEMRVVAAMLDDAGRPEDGGPPMSHLDYGYTATGRMSVGPVPQYFKPTDPLAQDIIDGVRDQIIGHDIPEDRLPPAAAEVTDE